MELAALKGSEKQVNWAKAIRKDRLKVWQGTDPDSFQAVESMLSQQGVASWWIASKDKSLGEVCSQFQGGAKPLIPSSSCTTASKKTPSGSTKIVSIAGVGQADEGELWETVETPTGFRRIGPTRDMVTGEVVVDAALPF
jgi:hypothetical protein